MKAIYFIAGAIVVLLLAILPLGCGNGSTTSTEPTPLPTNVPPVPIPDSPTEVLPATSGTLAVGLSDPVDDFEPLVSEIQLMQDDGSAPWIAVNRPLTLACADVLPEYSCDAGIAKRSFIGDRPRLQHERYWRKVKQVTLDPGTSYERAESITYGTSTSDTQSREFARTVGVDVSVGGDWKAFSATVDAYYEQTETESTVRTVTFSTETTTSQTYKVKANPDHTQMYALWQLVDRFSLVDANGVRIHDSPTLLHVRIPDIADIEFPNGNVIYESVTRF
jgi:hypothetical protein